MKNSRLANILKTFSPKEVRDFRKWITSPAHNSREDVVILFEYLTTRDRLEKEKYLAKERIFTKLYPNEQYDDAKMRQAIHFLSKTVENFLIYQELLEDEVRAKITLAGVFRKRKLGKNCEKTLRTIQELQKKQPYKNEQFLRNEYILEQETYNYLSGFERTNLNLQKMSDALDVTYLADKLQHSCLMLAHQSVIKKEYDKGILEDIMNYVERNDFLVYPAIAVYFFAYKAITEGQKNDVFFFKMKDEIEIRGHLFPNHELRNIYLFAINYCIKCINTGREEFVREVFNIYVQGCKRHILIENGILSKLTFLNIVINGTRLKEFDWVESFINEYQNYLPESQKENIVYYSFAKLFYEKGDYDLAMKYLVQYDYDDIILNLNSKTMLLKMYYETEEIDALESLLNSMSSFLNRKKVMGYHKAVYSNLIKLVKKLVRINPYVTEEKGNFIHLLNETNPLAVSNRKWLLEQLEKL